MDDAAELSKTITAFLDETAGAFDWDGAINARGLRDIREFCSDVQTLFPSNEPNRYTNAEGETTLARLAELLRESSDVAREFVEVTRARFPEQDSP